MFDLVLLAIGTGMFALALGYAVACDRLWRVLPWSLIIRSPPSWQRGCWSTWLTHCCAPSAF